MFISLILILPFCPIYLCPPTTLIKNSLRELKQNNWKYTYVTPLVPFASYLGFYSEVGLLFGYLGFYSEVRQSFFLWYWQLLRGRQYMPRLCLLAGQTTIFSTSSCKRLNFPALAKMWSYSVTFVRERFQLLRCFLDFDNALFKWEKFVFTARGTTSNICYPGKGKLRRCTCHFGSLPVA